MPLRCLCGLKDAWTDRICAIVSVYYNVFLGDDSVQLLHPCAQRDECLPSDGVHLCDIIVTRREFDDSRFWCNVIVILRKVSTWRQQACQHH